MTVTTGNDVAVRRPRLARSAFLAVLINVSGSALRLGLQILLARGLGTNGYGRFVLGRSWGEVLAGFPHRGYEQLAVKELASYRSSGRSGLFRLLVRRASRSTIAAAVVIAAVASLAYAVLVDRPDNAIQIGLLLVVPLAALRLAQWMLQGDHRFLTGSMLIELVQPISFAATLLVLWQLDRLTVVSSLTAWIATMAFSAVVGWVVFHRSAPTEAAPLDAAVAASETRRWDGTRRPLFVSRLAQLVLDNADLLLVGALLGADEVAAYAVGIRLALLGRIFVTGVQSVSSSHIAESAAAHDWAATQRVVDRSLAVCFYPSIALAAGGALLADHLVRLFGDDFQTAAPILKVLLLGILVDAVTGPCGYVVALCGLERPYAAVLWTSAIATVALVPVGAALDGAVGVAWVVTLVLSAWNVALCVLAYRRLRIRCWATPALLTPSSIRGSHP